MVESQWSDSLAWLDIRRPWQPGVDDVVYTERKSNAVELTLGRTRVPDVDFAVDLPGLRGLIVDGPVRDDRAAFAAEGLELLALRTRCKLPADLRRLHGLRSLALAWRPGLETMSGLSALETLQLQGFQGDDLSFLGSKPALDFMRLKCVNQQFRLDGIEGAPQLRELWIQDGRLESLHPLGGMTQLRELTVVADFNGIEGTVSLEPLLSHRDLVWLALSGWERVESLKPIRQLPALRNIGIREMEVVDGDLTPLLDLPPGATFMIRDDRPHYSHTVAEIEHLRKSVHKG